VEIVDPAGKAKRLESGVGVAGDSAEGIVIDALDDGAGADVDDEPRVTTLPLPSSDEISGEIASLLETTMNAISRSSFDRPQA
jgi:hypothetical protein